MADYRKHEILSGLFIMIALVVFSLFAFKVGDLDLFALFRGNALECRAFFTDVKSLNTGAAVKIGGQRVGKVTGVRMQDRRLSAYQVTYLKEFYDYKQGSGLEEGMVRQLIEVSFDLTDPDLKLNHRTARVALRQESPLAPHFLELDPGEWPRDEMPRTIFAAEYRSEIEKELAAEAGRITLEAREGAGLTEIVNGIKPTILEINTALTRINEEFLTHENADLITKILSDVRAVAAEARTLSTQVNSALSDDLRPGVRKILENLVSASGELDSRLDAIQGDLRSLLQDADSLVLDNRAGIAETIRRLRRTMWQAEMAMRKIRVNPSVLIRGDEETDLEALPGDDSWLRKSGRAAPYEQRDETNASKR